MQLNAVRTAGATLAAATACRCAQAEHSLELHTPYIARLMQGHSFTLVPIIVGALSLERCA